VSCGSPLQIIRYLCVPEFSRVPGILLRRTVAIASAGSLASEADMSE
jgi:hypothetical protein